MANLVTGFIGIVLVLVFLGFYAVGIHSVAFKLIVLGVGAMIVADFVQSLRNEKQKHRNGA